MYLSYSLTLAAHSKSVTMLHKDIIAEPTFLSINEKKKLNIDNLFCNIILQYMFNSGIISVELFHLQDLLPHQWIYLGWRVFCLHLLYLIARALLVVES